MFGCVPSLLPSGSKVEDHEKPMLGEELMQAIQNQSRRNRRSDAGAVAPEDTPTTTQTEDDSAKEDSPRETNIHDRLKKTEKKDIANAAAQDFISRMPKSKQDDFLRKQKAEEIRLRKKETPEQRAERLEMEARRKKFEEFRKKFVQHRMDDEEAEARESFALSFRLAEPKYAAGSRQALDDRNQAEVKEDPSSSPLGGEMACGLSPGYTQAAAQPPPRTSFFWSCFGTAAVAPAVEPIIEPSPPAENPPPSKVMGSSGNAGGPQAGPRAIKEGVVEDAMAAPPPNGAEDPAEEAEIESALQRGAQRAEAEAAAQAAAGGDSKGWLEGGRQSDSAKKGITTNTQLMSNDIRLEKVTIVEDQTLAQASTPTSTSSTPTSTLKSSVVLPPIRKNTAEI